MYIVLLDPFVKGYDGNVIEKSVIFTIEGVLRGRDNKCASSAKHVTERS